MDFKKIDMNTWPRREHFNYYINNIKCKYNLTSNIEITNLLFEIKKRNLRFYPSFIYVVSKAINHNMEFRMSYDNEGKLGYWKYTNPVYTLFHEDDKTFSDIWTYYNEDFSIFYADCVKDLETYKDVKGIKAKPNQPENFFPVSALPWLSFTGCSNISLNESKMLFPVITFGKYFKQDKKVFIPFSIMVNHAAADGYHTSKLINDIQDYCKNVYEWIQYTTNI
ncbi:chloramphenicol acetyltransferase [Clostridium tyrobutyricum]|uniref:CatA-like O-acetyltransferase n=1 Tax=Clostridium tyrobutyricum TaxID=1519 RepID=UPI001C38A14C|nr:CatA-like O-acetyltransferase [Clostridium tyrobutyricum]MBV4418454.1 chloramphenicol acetyltransferase [Clostridium tyrobutyricum]